MGCNSSKTKGAKKGKTGEETAPPPQQGSVNGAEAARDATASRPGDIAGAPVPPSVAAESTTTYGTPADGASERRGGSAEAAAAAQPAVETASAGKREADAAAGKEAAAAGPEGAHVENEEEGEGGQRQNADGATSTASSADEGSESDAAGAHGGGDAVEAQLQSPDPMSSTAREVQQAGAAAPVPASDAAGHTTDEFTPVATDEVTGVPASFSTRHEMSSPPPQEPLTTAAAPGTVPAEETSQGSEVHFEVLDTDEDAAVAENEEWPAVGEEEEEEPQEPQQLRGSTGAPRAPPPPPNLTDAEARTPMTMEAAPVPTPVRSAAGGGKARGSAAPSSNTSFHGPKQPPAGAGPRRPTSRKPSVAGSSVSAGAYASSRRPSWRPTKKQEQRLHQRPAWQSIVPELDEDEDYDYGHSPAARPPLPAAAAAPTTNTRPPPPGSQRSATSEEYYRVRAPAHPAAAAAAPPSPSASSTELVVHEAELPASTPTERIAARRWRAGMGQTAVADPPAMELAVHPRSSRGASTNASHPRQRRALRQVAVLPPIPYRQGYTDPSPGAAPHAHRPATTYMPPPTAFAMRSAADGSASARPVLDPKVFVAAIEASTMGLIQAHNPRVTAPTAAAVPAPHAHHDGSMAPSQHSAAPSLSASLASLLPVAGADATVYREPVKLAPSHLCDPVYSAAPAGNGLVSASASSYARNRQQARPQTVSVPAPPQPPQPPQPQRQAVYASPSQQSQRSAPASHAVAPASTAASSYKAPTASDTRARAGVRQRAPAPSTGYGDDVDAVSVDASSYRSAQEVSGGYEQVYSSAQEPRERSAVTYEPSFTDEAPPTSASMLQANAASRNRVAATNAAARTKANAARDEDSDDGYAEDEQQQQQHQREPSWSAAEDEDEYDDAYDDDGKAQPPSAEPEEAAVSSNGEAENKPATATALTAMPSSDGHVVEHKDPEWQLLQPPPAENRRLVNQAKFVAQMRNVTPI